MKRLHILVEGQTEETFVRTLLVPHLLERDVMTTPKLTTTKRVKAGGAFRGGVVSYAKVRQDVLDLLNDSSAEAVSTMLDYYGLPAGFPGRDRVEGRSPRERALHLERAFAEDIDNRRFLPHLSLHEFEAFLFVDPAATASVLALGSAGGLARQLTAVRQQFEDPEQINEGPTTHPSKRIEAAWPAYNKVRHGPLVAARVGLESIRAACPHFRDWLARLEPLGRG